MDLGQEPRTVATLTFGEVLTQSLTKQPQASKEGIYSQEASQSQGWAFAGSAISLEAEETEKRWISGPSKSHREATSLRLLQQTWY